MGLTKGSPRSFQQNLSGSITNYAIDSGVKGHTIPFVFSPDGLSDSVQASYDQKAIPGASAPQITYSSTGARQVSFTITLPLDYLPPSSDFNDFEDYLNAFRALVYPKYLSSGKVESPHCKLLTSNIELDGVCSNCTIEYKTDRYANDGSMSATVSLSFMEVIDNVALVDAKWIANSKVKVLGKTQVTNQRTSYGTGGSSASTTSSDTSRCYVTINGNQEMTISGNFGLKTAAEKGVWSDQGVTITHADKYTIKRLFGYSDDATASVSDIKVDNSGSHTCVCNGQKTSLQASIFNSSHLTYIGQVVTYFVVYVPVYDGNNYEVDSARVRYVHIKVVE